MISTLAKFGWFVARPKHWGDLPELIRRHTLPDRRDTDAADALAEYERLTIDAANLDRHIAGFQLIDFAERFPDEFAAAQSRCGTPLLKSGPGYLDVIYSVAEAIDARRVIETGVAYGWSSLALLLSLKHRPGSHLSSVDRPYPGLNQDIVGLAVPERLRPGWTLYRESDRRGVPMALLEQPEIDLCHYDSDKTYSGHLRTLPLLWTALRSGGVLICDDAGDNAGFLDFSRSVGVGPVVVKRKSKHVGILRKP
jgi:predicted O-methyltransferase YrrM